MLHNPSKYQLIEIIIIELKKFKKLYKIAIQNIRTNVSINNHHKIEKIIKEVM